VWLLTVLMRWAGSILFFYIFFGEILNLLRLLWHWGVPDKFIMWSSKRLIEILSNLHDKSAHSYTLSEFWSFHSYILCFQGDVETLKKYCTKEVIERCKGEREAYASQGIFFDHKVGHGSTMSWTVHFHSLFESSWNSNSVAIDCYVLLFFSSLLTVACCS